MILLMKIQCKCTTAWSNFHSFSVNNRINLFIVPCIELMCMVTFLAFYDRYIFESNLLELLLGLLMRYPFRNASLKCLTEIGGLEIQPSYNDRFIQLFTVFMNQLQQFLPPTADIPTAFENGSDYDEIFFQVIFPFLISHIPSHFVNIVGLYAKLARK